jgi:lipopolysaccharide biosynthesis protein
VILAFYLPQFHPIPENDKWWGYGFTEWTNVATACPRFKGHHQPQIPADLGFYDLRLEETRVAQAELAARYGIDGFCYYHYWFNGKILLGRPFDEVLSSGQPDFPFCLCWANENWTRAWDGLEREILIEQKYSDTDNNNHIDWLIKSFYDNRYIKINGKPLLLIYRPDKIPEPHRTIDLWKKSVQSAGFDDLYLCAVKNGFMNIEEQSIINQGYDAIVDFQPNKDDFPKSKNLRQLFYDYSRILLPESIYQKLKLSVSATKLINYQDLVEGKLKKSWPTDYYKFPCVFPSWDNTARRKTPTIIQNTDPQEYERWLCHSIKLVQKYKPENRFVFINAWNEWAEGCHLEPDRQFGHALLEATKRATSGSK